MQQGFPKLITIFFNIFPIIGVAFYNWLPFEMFWLFWLETLIIAVFNTIRVLYSQGHSQQQMFDDEPLDYNPGKAFKYILGRVFVFLFYSVFIIVFIGFLSSPKNESLHVMQTIALTNKLFNLALILSICSQAYYLIRYFFMNRAYYYTSPESFPMLFDGRQIVIHVAVVLGALGGTFLFKGNDNPKFAAIWVIGILCVVKCVYELFTLDSYEALKTEQGQKTNLITD